METGSSQSTSENVATQYVAAGSIASVHLRNFMCHDNLEVKLNSRINFICGSNGSGKSAIQTAIAVGLGGKAITTNRGSSVKSLIQTGKNSSYISVVLNNTGPSAYQPETYGHLIQVERTFSHTSTQGYKIKSAHGNIVSTEKKVLDQIVNHLGIQTDNPVCILHQDVARNFLSSTDPKLLFKFYQKSTRFGDIDDIYDECWTCCETIKNKVKAKYKVIEEVFKDVIEMKKKLQIMEETKEKEVYRDHLKNELIWAKINEDEKELCQLNKVLEQEMMSKKRLEQKLNESEESSLKEKLSELEQKVTETDSQAAEAREKINAARNKLRLKKDKFADKVQEYNECKNRARLNKNKYQSCLEQIENHSKNAPEKKMRQEKCKSEIADLERELEGLNGVERTLDNDWQQFSSTVDNNNATLSVKRAALDDIRRRKRKTEDQLRQLLSSSNNSLAVYGPAMVKIVEEVQRAVSEHKFGQQPIGPLGKHIKVRDESWAPAVENYLGKNFLFGFCVDNSQDLDTLNKMLKRICGQYRVSQPNVFCSKFINKVHDISSVETGTRQHPSLAQMLSVSHPVVFNCLVDQLEVETVLLINTNSEAYDLLDEVDKVPRYCKKAFTKTGDRFFPAPNYKSYSNTSSLNHATLLQTNQTNVIRQMKAEIQQLVAEEAAAERERVSAEERAAATRAAITANQQEQRNVKRQKLSVEMRIRELRNELEPETQTNCGFFEQEAEELRACLTRDTELLQKLKEDVERLKEEEGSAKEEYDDLQKRITACDNAKAPLLMKIQRMKIMSNEAAAKTDIMRQKMSECDERLAGIEERLSRQREALTESEESASQVCDRLNTQRTSNEIQRELKNLEEYLKQMEIENGGTLETLQSTYQAREQQFMAVKREIQGINQALKMSLEALGRRRVTHGKMQSLMSYVVQGHFRTYLVERNYESSLLFDFNEKTLEIRVGQGNPKVSKSTTLSGGEKSFATVSLIMAMWTVIGLPFHFLDEFDVFMDGINRRTVMDLLVSNAKDSRRQFVFLTPLDMSSQTASDIITIHRLENPRD